MVAVLAPTPISTPAARPALRVIDGGRAPRRPTAPGRPSTAVYLRRRLVVGAVVLAFLAVLVVGVTAVAPLLAAPVAPTTPVAVASAAAPIAADTYVVRPGDTLWSIAARLDPTGDPRPLVDALRERAGGAALESGQRIDVAGLGA